MEDYKCSICGKTHVKLWRPYMDIEPLVCAECAEKRQLPRQYKECSWSKNENEEGYTGTFTGKVLSLPKWKVDKKGKIPHWCDPGPKEVPIKIMTDQLFVDLSDVSTSYTSESTSLIPAFPHECGGFWSYSAIPESVCKWWENLPTR